MKNKIVYDGRTFEATDIKSGQIHLASSLPSMKLEPNTIIVVVKSGEDLTKFTRNTPMYYYHRDRLVCISYIQTVDRIGPNKYKFYGTSAIGRLIEQPHAGGIYTGQTAAEVITDICGPVPFEIKNVLKKIKLYGWLPYANPPKRSARDNLVQVLFAIGAAIRTDLDGVLRIEGLWDGISGTVGRDKMYTGANTEYDGVVTQVIVTEHQYVPWTEEKQLFEGTAQAGDVITFDEPMHDLVAQGFTIQASGANWARVSAGSGTLTGKTYIHNTRQVSKAVQEANTPNVKTVEDATLVSLANSTAVANRLADYYRCRERVDSAVVYQGETPGDRLATYHPFDKTGVAACLESADITLSNTLKAQEKLLVGYVPPQMGDVQYFDYSEEITVNTNWDVPEGVTEITVVCIGGGQGGQKGGDGEKGEKGTDAYTTGNLSKPSGLVQGKPGNPGAGGTKGSGGSGGKVYVSNVDVTGVASLSIVIGAGGAANGGAGGASTVTAGDTTYSSDSGSSSSNGYTDIITGKTYATPGLPGDHDGGKGGKGVSGTSGSGEPGESVAGYAGGAGNRLAYHQYSVAYTLPAGGGGAAYGNVGSAADKYCIGGNGANAVQNKSAPTLPGCGGHGGNGGGGGGGGGAGYIYGGLPENRITAYGVIGGEGGLGSTGTVGAPGIVLLFYRKPQRNPAGQLVDKHNRMVLDRLGRRIIM